MEILNNRLWWRPCSFLRLICPCLLVAIQPWILHAAYASESEEACTYDRRAMLALGEAAFDQDMDGGWRKVAHQDGCKGVAADLIRDYREANNSVSQILYWHEGQLRAMVGQTDQAIDLFELSRKSEKYDRLGWNFYVDATIAFLNKEREELERAHDALSALPRPDSYKAIDADGNPVEIPWPPNLNVVAGFLECFSEDYDTAYNECARPLSTLEETH